jgi:DNA repair protein RecO (recombination protein O)
MAFIKTEAIVIKAINFGEADQIITFFSEHYGKLQGIAKGIRKIKTRYGGKLGLFQRIKVIFFQKTAVLQSGDLAVQHPLLRITQVDLVENFTRLQADFNKIIGASYVAEFLNRIFEEYDNTHAEVYALVCNTLQALDESDNLRNILPAFEIKLLAHLGYIPILERCAVCGRLCLDAEEKLGFSSVTGGILCQRCKRLQKGSLDITSQAIRMLRQFLYLDIRQVSALPLPKERYLEIKHLLANHFQYHLGLSLKTEAFVQKLRMANLLETH